MPASSILSSVVCRFVFALLLVAGALPLGTVAAQEEAEKEAPPAEPDNSVLKPEDVQLLEANGIRKLMPNMPVWIDLKRKMVIMDGEVCLRKGSLEMFACLRGTKEHESVIAVPADAFVVHAGLLRIGAKQGVPVSFDPEYTPPSGEVIDVLLQWTDDKNKLRTARAQEWVREAKGKKEMPYNWVFPGSYFWKDIPLEEIKKAKEQGIDPDTLPGKQVYAAEGGELICVSNFRSSMLDLPVPSTDANNNLWFEANTEKIPPEGTKVRIFLIPNKGKTAKLDAAQKAKAAEKPKPEKEEPQPEPMNEAEKDVSDS
ncbi:YdjY domain-containing protein [Blastopirellula marina]|uniref:Uncharacterized protein n=1 Tax=Blastopirellula marina TaxID=124 RepID=A0A2S8G0D6_9BACT|nr:YdjY domain-containing protein [Blastopirellula marina]PQO37897.1 hypothetical protein C5Y98_07315 [Blastopirellula marina]PTL44553.1 hypothetical protein C5Y97_07315 [Blastopirellula marina]